jgi:uncharacterized protein Usg
MERDFVKQLQGYSLATVEIHYYMPDHPSLLQQFIWQQYDMAPQFPALARFLDYWRREIEAPIHSVRVAHQQLIGPTGGRAIACPHRASAPAEARQERPPGFNHRQDRSVLHVPLRSVAVRTRLGPRIGIAGAEAHGRHRKLLAHHFRPLARYIAPHL